MSNEHLLETWEVLDFWKPVGIEVSCWSTGIFRENFEAGIEKSNLHFLPKIKGICTVACCKAMDYLLNVLVLGTMVLPCYVPCRFLAKWHFQACLEFVDRN